MQEYGEESCRQPQPLHDRSINDDTGDCSTYLANVYGADGKQHAEEETHEEPGGQCVRGWPYK